MDYTVHGILQARVVEWVAFPFYRGSSQTCNVRDLGWEDTLEKGKVSKDCYLLSSCVSTSTYYVSIIEMNPEEGETFRFTFLFH